MGKDYLIKDKDYEKPLKELGFCTFPLLAQEDVAKLQAIYDHYFGEVKIHGMYANHNANPFELNKSISESIKQIVYPSLEKHFAGFKFFISHFVVKEANTESEFSLHQDWNILDESKYTSYQLWIPLEVSSQANGGMFVLPGSQDFYRNYRSGSYGIPVVTSDDVIGPYITHVVLPPGNTLVFNNSTFHGSFPNKSGRNRISVIVNIYQEDAPLYFHHLNKDKGVTELYPIDSDKLLQSLPTLEKGILPADFANPIVAPLNEADNKTITSTDLLEKYTAKFGPDLEEFVPLQLRIANDEELEHKINKEGYAVIDFLDEKTVKEITDWYLVRYGDREAPSGRFSTLEHVPHEEKLAAHQYFGEVLKPFLEATFHDYVMPGSTYFIKKAHSAGDLDWHNDASLLLNAHLEPHYALWVPLIDVDAHNGALTIVPKSHKICNFIYTFSISWPFNDLVPTIDRVSKVIDMKAGQAVVFDIRCIHNATKNNSDHDRLSFNFRLTHKKSDYYSFFREDPTTNDLSVYPSSHDVYMVDEWDGYKSKPGFGKVGTLINPYADIDVPKIAKELEAENLQPA